MPRRLILMLVFPLVLLAAYLGFLTSSPPSPEVWTTQFGTDADDGASAVAVDGEGNVLVAGYTGGPFPGQPSAGGRDAFVRKYGRDGNPLWTRQFGTERWDEARAIAVDGEGSVLVAGYTDGAFPGQPSAGGWDVFVRKYDGDGNELWTRQFGTNATDEAYALAVDAEGNVLVTGVTRGTLPGQAWAGGVDAFVRKYDKDGRVRWTTQFGTEAADIAYAVAVDSAGNVLVAGYTLGALPNQTRADEWDAFVVKYDKDGNPLWTRQFGTNADDQAYAVAVDGGGNILVAGYTDGTLPGQTRVGDWDAFVRKYDGDGNPLWTGQFGTERWDEARAIAVDREGRVLVAGFTSGGLPDQTRAGGVDALVHKYGRDGNPLWTRQFGTDREGRAHAVAVDGNGNVLVAGATEGALPGQPSAGGWDAFVRKYRP